jgi:hypothetical protein
MKKLNKNIFLSLFAILLSASSVQAQVEISTGADFYNIWRGAQLDASAVQPYIEYTTGNLTIGTWGSYSTSALNLQEVDFYFSYALGDLSVGITDYYIPENDIFDLDTDHVVEANLGYSLGDISVSANYTFAGATDGDTYVELGYSGTEFDVFAGLGNNAYVTNFNGDVGLVNFGFSTSKEIEITEKFSLPIYGSLIVNPESRIGYLVFGISL